MKTIKHLFVLAILASMTACVGKTAKMEDFSNLDLSDKGIPIVLSAPKDAKIHEGTFHGKVAGVMYYDYDISAESMDGFLLNVSYCEDSCTLPLEELIADMKNQVMETKGFIKFTRSEPNGFIYTYANGSGEEADFIYMKMIEGRKVEFSSAGRLRERKVRNMYKVASSVRSLANSVTE